MINKKYITKSANQTRKIGEKMAREILCLPREKSISPTALLSLGERWGSALTPSSKGAGGAVRKHAIVIAMEGDLGGGKTTFIQGFAKGLGIKENITSPTFVILKKFEIPLQQCHSEGASRRPKNPPALVARAEQKDSSLHSGSSPRSAPTPMYWCGGSAQNDKSSVFYHIDAYRIEKSGDLLNLGVKNILSDRNNIVAIEWSEKVQKILFARRSLGEGGPKNVIKIKFEFVDENTRKIVINPPSSF